MRDDLAFLEDILERIDLTTEFVTDGREAFESSRVTQEAVIRNLEIIGEAARHISDDLRSNHPEIPWKQIIAFRNFVTHVYWGIKLERIWQIIEDDLMPLRKQVSAIIQELDSQTDDT